MKEQTKAAHRRLNDNLFHTRYFIGKGIDVGGKPDPLGQYVFVFAGMESCDTWDLEQGDGQYLTGIPDCSYDFLHSSHCLEHLKNPEIALENWIRVVKPNGFLIITVPDEDMYEFPKFKRFNKKHRWSFTIYKKQSWCAKSINILDLVVRFSDLIEPERISLIRDFYNPKKKTDQTRGNAECAIEFIWRRKK